uniref:Putative secreted protein n=1 Tax=Ixodes ricinus TaxID=34613 RepID=A0A6B0UBU1_IXORI
MNIYLQALVSHLLFLLVRWSVGCRGSCAMLPSGHQCTILPHHFPGTESFLISYLSEKSLHGYRLKRHCWLLLSWSGGREALVQFFFPTKGRDPGKKDRSLSGVRHC